MNEMAGKAPTTDIADRDTPLIRNCWYVLDWSDEVGRELNNRMVLNQSLVYFRTRDGGIVALQNRCAHRGFPLHRSTLHDDDTIQCGYHGLTYDTSGACVKVPSALDMDTSSIGIQRYPIVEKPPMVWIWTGDPARADPGLLPDYDWVNSDEWGYGTGFYHVKGNYLAIHENLMDITHFQYLHGAALGTPKHAESKITVTVDGDTVDNYRVNEGEPVPQLHQRATRLGDAPIIRHAHSTFITPGFHDALGKFEDPAGTVDGRTEYQPHILHFITPETQYTSLYWWIFARDFTPRDAELDAFYSDATSKVFEEDKDAIEWIEDQWARDDRPGYREKHVPSDEGAVKMRRIVTRLAEAERAGEA
ncbi:MAG: aromatic ring-hydroxylating dioxygenase subunit alpha [Rhodospirillales bacterium]|nr:aromatic ring-hydroxylating dioxygenase subunit alpha [Rhodospirillales bacterium]